MPVSVIPFCACIDDTIHTHTHTHTYVHTHTHTHTYIHTHTHTHTHTYYSQGFIFGEYPVLISDHQTKFYVMATFGAADAIGSMLLGMLLRMYIVYYVKLSVYCVRAFV